MYILPVPEKKWIVLYDFYHIIYYIYTHKTEIFIKKFKMKLNIKYFVIKLLL